MAEVYFKEAPEVKELAQEIIDEHHPHLEEGRQLQEMQRLRAAGDRQYVHHRDQP